ncbi:MAG: tetratricopeptide repeat protein [Sandaracinus sp.]|nr:tetratricopeptide repeat protein [Myxococcales bacterium]MCB9600320.1 tetratricopeptide repeat protein [Sandaracinus sp.]MCB9613098.1 tetratricopeptide repeat protein [Sandaracinus sp.]MCB9624647.1 tetratricopeptide repeat protein [Sandaracinus sp.]MCB9632772.1 tetratricopeptide repeat protein [Sandaracinus sp.]
MRTTLFLLAALTMASFSGLASAQDARELFQRGRGAYETGDFEGAVAAWQAAYELDPRPLLQFNLAQAYERLGRLEESLAAYERFLADSPGDAADVPQARIRAAALQQRLARTGIVLRGGPEGARVLVDGEERARLPRLDPLTVSPGSYRVQIEAEGYEPFDSVVAVAPGAQVEVEVSMRAVSAGPVPSEEGGISMIGVGVAAGGGALLVGGAVTGVLALGAANDAETSDDSDADRARTLGLVTDILLGVGAAAAITGVVLLFVLDGGDSDRATAVAPMLGPDRVGIGAIHRF